MNSSGLVVYHYNDYLQSASPARSRDYAGPVLSRCGNSIAAPDVRHVAEVPSGRDPITRKSDLHEVSGPRITCSDALDAESVSSIPSPPEFLWEVVEETRDHAPTLLDPEGRIFSWHDGARVIVHARVVDVSPSQAAIAASTTACSTLLEATSRACMARPSTTVV